MVASALVLTLVAPLSAFAAPEDNYGWMKNIGTPGCADAMYAQRATLAHGKVYVTDAQNRSVNVFDTNGNFLQQVGSSGDGSGQFINPFGVAVDSAGAIYVGDTYSNTVQKFAADGTYLSQFTPRSNGSGVELTPYGMHIDPAGNLVLIGISYALQPTDQTVVQKYTTDGTYISQFGGAFGSGDG